MFYVEDLLKNEIMNSNLNVFSFNELFLINIPPTEYSTYIINITVLMY